MHSWFCCKTALLKEQLDAPYVVLNYCDNDNTIHLIFSSYYVGCSMFGTCLICKCVALNARYETRLTKKKMMMHQKLGNAHKRKDEICPRTLIQILHKN